MGVSYAGFPCEVPDSLAENCLNAEPPLPLSPWWGFANRYVCPLGLRPGYAHILMLSKHFSELTDGKETLSFANNTSAGNNTICSFPNLRVAGTPICVTPGLRDDPNAVFFIELVDRRVDCVGFSNKLYNWRPFPDAPRDTSSLNSGVAWTWTTLLGDLWDAVGGLGTFPDLPRSLSGTPEQIDATACRAADMLEDLLLLNGMAIAYNPFTDAFRIVDVTINRDDVMTELDSLDVVRLWDQEPQYLDAYIPKYARVVFPVWAMGGLTLDSTSYYAVDVEDTAQDASTAQNSYSVIQDFSACRVDMIGDPLNKSSLVTRAADVAAVFFRKSRSRSQRGIYRIFGGFIKSKNIVPGGLFDVVCWEDTSQTTGPRTHVVQTSRQGFAPIVNPTPYAAATSGQMMSGAFSTAFLRTPNNQQTSAIIRAGAWPPDEFRTYGTGPLQSPYGNSAAELSRGSGTGPLLLKAGPLRQWDDAVMSRSVGSQGQFLWKPYTRPQFMCMVEVTSVTPSGSYYPAREIFIEPNGLAGTVGSDCWYYDPNGGTPIVNSYHLCFLDGTDGSGTPKKVYFDGANANGPAQSLTVQANDGTPSYANTTTIKLDEDDGLYLTQPSANTVLIQILDAGTLNAGIVSTGSQTITGDKTLDSHTRLSRVTVDYAAGGGSGIFTVESERNGAGGPTPLISTFSDASSENATLAASGEMPLAASRLLFVALYSMDGVADASADFSKGISFSGVRGQPNDYALIRLLDPASHSGGSSSVELVTYNASFKFYGEDVDSLGFPNQAFQIPSGSNYLVGSDVGVNGTGGGGDTVTGGVITALGTGPATIDGGTW